MSSNSNVSLIDLSVDELSATLNKTISKNAAIAPETSQSNIKVFAKPVRNVKPSGISIESEKNQLAFTLFAAIKRELKGIDSLSKQCRASDVSLEFLDECITAIESKAETMTSDYAKLSQLSNNKVEKKVQQYFEYFVGEVESAVKKLTSKRDVLQQEQQDLAQSNSDEMDRELLELEQFIEQRKRQQEEEEVDDNPDDEEPNNNNPQPADDRIRTTPVQPCPPSHSTPRLMDRIQQYIEEERATPQPQQQDFNASLNQLAENIAIGIRSTKKTEIEPEVFSGNPLEFDDWQCDFDSYIDSMGITDGAEKIRYLKKYVSGPAKECISGLFMVRTENSYREARKKLRARFGNKLDVARSMRTKLDNWPKIAANDSKALQKYADYLENCRSSMSSLPGLSILEDPQINEKLSTVLPDWARRKWANKVYKIKKNSGRYPRFEEFSYFLNEIAEMQSEPLLHNHQTRSKDTFRTDTQQYKNAQPAKPQPKTASKTFATSQPKLHCLFCQGDRAGHKTAECLRLAELPYQKRIAFIESNRLCYRCLDTGHGSTSCPNKTKVKCKTCHYSHASALHKRKEDWLDDTATQKSYRQQAPTKERPVNETTPTASPADRPAKAKSDTSDSSDKQPTCNRSTAAAPKQTLFNMGMPVYVSTAENPSNQVLIYAFFDSAADHSYITTDIAEKLQPKTVKTKSLDMQTMSGISKAEVREFGNLVINGLHEGEARLNSAYEWPQIPNTTGEFGNSLNVMAYDHLAPLADVLPPPMDIPIGLLVGANCSSVHFPLDGIKGEENQPFAVKNKLGWMVFGVETPSTDKSKCHATSIEEEDDDSPMSQDDLLFLDQMEAEATVTKSGSYQMPLPFKTRPKLPDNFVQAKQRQEALIKRFKKDPSLKEEYTTFVDDLIDLGMAEEVDTAKPTQPGEVWYIPHFAVTHPQKKKLRVVFDCKASYQGVSLNDTLLQGPDNMNSLLGILCRFRRELVAVSCDIQKMFYNFLVDPKDRDFIRFLWNDENDELKTYRMKVHLFGAKSSPAVATYGLRRLAEDHRETAPEAADFICKDFYVDDGLTSMNSAAEAIKLVNAARDICQKGNLRLHKFISNDPEVLSALPESERSVQNTELFSGHLPEQRTLGLQWSTNEDCFKFINNVTTKPSTRRGILSVVSQLYDPLGFIAPYTLIGKNILQSINKENPDWDAPVSRAHSQRWEKWTKMLPQIEEIKIPRCYKPKNFGGVSKRELHHFCDASENGIGACSYLRQKNEQGDVKVSLVLAKARVIPSKGLVTTPRLELASAVMATQLSVTLERELNMKIDKEYFWTDSMITIGRINNDSAKFTAFVSNRLRLIHSRSHKSQWHHVPGDQNPADIASRGKPCSELSNSIWFSGPQFLAETEIQTPTHHPSKLNHDMDPELKKVEKGLKTTVIQASVADRFSKFSTWNRLKQSVAIIQSITKSTTGKWTIQPVTAATLHNASVTIISKIQEVNFNDEIKHIRYGERLSRKSPISKLYPFLDKEGLLRVGGRAKQSSALSYEEKHPIILPQGSHVSTLIARHYHSTTNHQGKPITQSRLRTSGFWLIGAGRTIKSIINTCILCRRLRGKPVEQVMADLPAERVEPSPPFTNVGIDCFGPFIVKDRRTEVKRWGLLLTCLYSRAVHVEILDDMSSDSFITALRAFISLRGNVHTIYCDQGTNFIGAANELVKGLESSDPNTHLGHYLRANAIEFKFNAPHASHTGGAWERQIRSIRAAMELQLRKHQGRLSSSGLRVAFYEAMAIVNSRPISAQLLNDSEVSVITPNHLLTGKSTNITLPPGDFDSTEVYGKKMWRKIQQMADEFWFSWKNSYLQNITKRQRWECPQPSLQPGDIVLVMEDNAPRYDWPTGVIIEASPGSDGRVRRVKIKIATAVLYTKGTVLERPVQKLILLLKNQ
ncbi:uncharacterized protein [Watersipora subatra]|uniref:uncharacterized protein n=1 Tax=Watersipora subatra TaxID=2589382 RepID=UPI00355BE32F